MKKYKEEASEDNLNDYIIILYIDTDSCIVIFIIYLLIYVLFR